VRDIRAPLLDPTDLRGLPVVEEKKARWCAPAFLPHDPGSSGVLFFDELNAAPPLVQASLYQLTLDRRIGEYELPEKWRIVAAGNRSSDASVIFRMPSALANRFIHLDFEVDFEDWRAWATKANVHPLIIGFLSLRRELLFDMSRPERGFPTPRSWEMLSDVLGSMGEPAPEHLPVYVGTVGEGAAVEFLAFCQSSMSEVAIRRILADPENEPVPSTLADQYALIAYVPALARKEDVSQAAARLLMRLKPEFAVLLLRNMLQVSKNFGRLAEVRQFMATHGSLLL
jgi:hypothetical protein